MPFNPSRPPTEKIKGLDKLSKSLQRTWVKVWNDVHDGFLKKNGKVSKDEEESCYRQAWSVVNKLKKKRRVALLMLSLDDRR